MAEKHHIERHGQSATVTNFTEDTTDKYGDPSFTESTESTHVIVGRVGMEGSDIVVNASGQDIISDAELYIPDDVTLHDGNDGNYPSEITVGSTDYEVQLIDDYGNGILHCLCKII